MEAQHQPADATRGAGWGSLGGLLRGGGSVIGQISGMDGPARSLDRLAVSAERAAALVERLEAEVTVEYVLETLERLHRLADVIEEMNRSVRAMEVAIVDLHARESRRDS